MGRLFFIKPCGHVFAVHPCDIIQQNIFRTFYFTGSDYGTVSETVTQAPQFIPEATSIALSASYSGTATTLVSIVFP